MDFFVGQKVVCVDDNRVISSHPNLGSLLPWPLKKGDVYTVRWQGMHNHPILGESYCIRVEGITRCDILQADCPFRASRFRPVEYKAMSVFRKIAIDVTEGKTAEIVDA